MEKQKWDMSKTIHTITNGIITSQEAPCGNVFLYQCSKCSRLKTVRVTV